MLLHKQVIIKAVYRDTFIKIRIISSQRETLVFYTENLNAHRRYIAMRGGGALPLAIVRDSLHFLIRSSLFLFSFFLFLTFTVSHRENLIEQ